MGACMPINIGVMELHDHQPETIFSEASLAKHSGANITIFTTRILYEEALPFFKSKKDDYHWFLKQETETLRCFLRRVAEYCSNNIDLLILNTFYILPHHQIIYYLFRPKCKIVHLAGRPELLFGEWLPIKYGLIKEFILSVLHNISQFIRKRTLPVFDGIWVENNEAYNYAISKGYNKKIACFFYHYYWNNIHSNQYSDSDKLKFIVIGGLINDRRDYNSLLDIFEKLFNSGRRDVTLTLLGSPYSRGHLREEGFKIIDRCRKLKEKGLDINFYTDFIPEEEFKDKVSSADIIINPSRTMFYGTGTSGAIFNAMRFAKPGIYPMNSLHHEELLSSSIIYNKIEELLGIIENLLNNLEIVRQLSRNALANSEKFSLEKMAEKFQGAILRSHLYDS
jgi:hypothetical protein